MGTTTIYKRMNDFGIHFKNMTKRDLTEMEKLSPWNKDSYYMGWNAPLELHNGNVYVLVFWKGRLMELSEAPKFLNKKYYNKYIGKIVRKYEWTLLKNMILSETKYLYDSRGNIVFDKTESIDFSCGLAS